MEWATRMCPAVESSRPKSAPFSFWAAYLLVQIHLFAFELGETLNFRVNCPRFFA